MFKWACFMLTVIVVIGFGWIVNDLRVELKHTSRTVNEQLPEILTNVKKSTETLAMLTEDLKRLRDLAGLVGKDTPRGRTSVVYADSILDLIEAADAQIGLKKKILGNGLKSTMSAQEWVTHARKEALWQTFRVKSRKELLERLTENKFGSPWFIECEGRDPVTLEEWLKANHPETQDIY